MERSGDATGRSKASGWVALFLAAVGILVLAAALWNLATILPDVLGAKGTHMAGDAKFYVAVVIVPLTVLAFVLLATAWAVVRRRERAGRLAAAALALAGVAVIGSAATLALPVFPAETLIPADTPRVHVSMTDGALTLTPSAVSSGPVYLLIDASAASVSLIGRSYATQAEIDAHRGHEPGPLSDGEVDAIARGDLYLTSTFAGLGDVAWWDLLPGKYVLATEDPAILASQGRGRAAAGTLAVLTVASESTTP